jgi:hypothetical protein
MKAPRRPWTPHEMLRARAMRRNGLTFTDIDRALGRSYGAAYNKLVTEPGSQPSGHNVGSIRVADELIAERDRRREAAARRTITQEIFGDPPPGYSALDRSSS